VVGSRSDRPALLPSRGICSFEGLQGPCGSLLPTAPLSAPEAPWRGPNFTELPGANAGLEAIFDHCLRPPASAGCSSPARPAEQPDHSISRWQSPQPALLADACRTWRSPQHQLRGSGVLRAWQSFDVDDLQEVVVKSATRQSTARDRRRGRGACCRREAQQFLEW